MADFLKISREYFRKISGQGVYQKYLPTPYSRCLLISYLNKLKHLWAETLQAEAL